MLNPRCKECKYDEIWYNKNPCKKCLISPYGSANDAFESKEN